MEKTKTLGRMATVLEEGLLRPASSLTAACDPAVPGIAHGAHQLLCRFGDQAVLRSGSGNQPCVAYILCTNFDSLPVRSFAS